MTARRGVAASATPAPESGTPPAIAAASSGVLGGADPGVVGGIVSHPEKRWTGRGWGTPEREVRALADGLCRRFYPAAGTKLPAFLMLPGTGKPQLVAGPAALFDCPGSASSGRSGRQKSGEKSAAPTVHVRQPSSVLQA